MDPNSLDVLFPISLVAGVVFMVSFSQYLSYRNRKRTLLLMEQVLKNEATPNHKTLEAIAWAKPRAFADYRRGCLLLAAALGVFVFSFAIDSNGARNVLRGIAAMPCFLGLTYLFFHFRAQQEKPMR